VESSVSVSLESKQDATKTKQVGGHLEEMHVSRHQLVCCTCIMYKPSMLVGECGCLSCIDCLDLMKHRYCNICQVSARYISLDKLLKVSKDGYIENIFMDTNVWGKVSIKELHEKVVKEKRDFKIVCKIMDKQVAALEKRNYSEKKEMQEILDEEKTLKQKILTKYEVISKLEEALKLKQDVSYPVQQDQHHLAERHNKSIGHKVVASSVDRRVGGAVIRNQINLTPYMDNETKPPVPIVLKSILKKRSHRTINQLPMTYEGIDEVGGSESNKIGREMFKVNNGDKLLKNVSFATVDQRKMTTQSVSVGKEMKDKGVGNKMMISQTSQDNSVMENSKLNVKIEKAGSKRKVMNIGSELSKNEDPKRMKLAAPNDNYSRRTSMKDGVMDRAVKNRADLSEGLLASNYGEWRNDEDDERRGGRHGKELTFSHLGEWKGRNGEGSSVGHVKHIVNLTPGSVEAEKKEKFTPLPSVYHPTTKSDRSKETRKKINKKNEHNMTYDYLDAIVGSSNAPTVNNEGPSFNSNKKIRVKDASHQSDLAGEIARSGEVGVAGKNSELFWEKYLL